MIGKRFIKALTEYITIAVIASLSAINYIIFIFPNKFAPSGIDGICTMIQDVFKINIGYLSLMVNIPLLVLAHFFLKKEFIKKTAVYIIAFSVASLIFKNVVDISFLCYHTQSGTSIVLAPVAAGTIRGILYVFTLKLNGSSGGTDIISAIIKKKKPYVDLMSTIFYINMVIALGSFFVYGYKFEPVICGIIYQFLTSNVSNTIMSSRKESVRFEIVTAHEEEICNVLSDKLNQTATVISAKGAFSGQDKKVLLCITGKKKAPEIEKLVKGYPDSIYFESMVSDRGF